MLLSLARDLKSESVRQRLRERSAARLLLVEDDAGLRVTAAQEDEGLDGHLHGEVMEGV